MMAISLTMIIVEMITVNGIADNDRNRDDNNKQ